VSLLYHSIGKRGQLRTALDNFLLTVYFLVSDKTLCDGRYGKDKLEIHAHIHTRRR
jgi:hypothetical protein